MYTRNTYSTYFDDCLKIEYIIINKKMANIPHVCILKYYYIHIWKVKQYVQQLQPNSIATTIILIIIIISNIIVPVIMLKHTATT